MCIYGFDVVLQSLNQSFSFFTVTKALSLPMASILSERRGWRERNLVNPSCPGILFFKRLGRPWESKIALTFSFSWFRIWQYPMGAILIVHLKVLPLRHSVNTRLALRGVSTAVRPHNLSKKLVLGMFHVRAASPAESMLFLTLLCLF